MKKLKNFLSIFKQTPFHPQWLVYRLEEKKCKVVIDECSGLVLDVGCAESTLKPQINLTGADYVGLDYFVTATEWYGCTPDVYGDAHTLPIQEGAIDTVLLLNVLEHLENPIEVIEEIFRVLKVGGKLVLDVPFLYPLHDAPRDFHRWSIFGLKDTLESAGFKVENIDPSGNTIVTAFLILNIGICEWCLGRLSASKLYALNFIWVVPVVLLSNILGLWASFFKVGPNRGPMGLSVVAVKESGL